jgi:hypothetical protein
MTTTLSVLRIFAPRTEADTFPTAASPSRTSFTLLLGFGCAEASAIVSSDVVGAPNLGGDGIGS